MEYTPGAYEVKDRWTEILQLPQMLMTLLKLNYTILHVADNISRAPLLEMGTWEGQIGAFEEVVLENVQYDASDGQLLQSRTLGCPKPKQLQDANK